MQSWVRSLFYWSKSKIKITTVISITLKITTVILITLKISISANDLTKLRSTQWSWSFLIGNADQDHNIFDQDHHWWSRSIKRSRSPSFGTMSPWRMRWCIFMGMNEWMGNGMGWMRSVNSTLFVIDDAQKWTRRTAPRTFWNWQKLQRDRGRTILSKKSKKHV